MKLRNSGSDDVGDPMDVIANRWHIKRIDRRTEGKVEPYYTIIDSYHNIVLGAYSTAKEARIKAMETWEAYKKNQWNDTANRFREQVHASADVCSDIIRLGEALRLLRGE